MARTPKKSAKTAGNIASAEGRSGMAACKTGPHWVAITPGTALGYFKGARDRSWWVRPAATCACAPPISVCTQPGCRARTTMPRSASARASNTLPMFCAALLMS